MLASNLLEGMLRIELNFHHAVTFILHFIQTCLSKLCVLVTLLGGFHLEVADKKGNVCVLKT